MWFCGYVRICVNGNQVNRFLNLCSRNGIRLWQITYDMEHVLRANLGLVDFFDLKPYLKKTKTHLKVVSKRGFPFWCIRHRRLKWFLCFCICIICVGIYSCNFLWDIRITGNRQISTEEIIDCLNQNDVKKGQNRNEIDCSYIETVLRNQFENLGWVSVYFSHTHLCVDVKESLYEGFDETDILQDKQYNLVANKDAKITSIITREGEALVKKDDFVKKGDILVLGQCTIYDDSYSIKDILYFPADAMIYGDVDYEILIPLTEMEILALRICNQLNDNNIWNNIYRKIECIEKQFSKNEKIILEKEIKVYKKDESVCFLLKLKVREQIGINIPVEEVVGNEFE